MVIFLRHWLIKRPNSCWHQCHEIANCIGSFDSNKTVVSQYYRQNMQPKMTSAVHTSMRRRDVRTSTRQLKATVTRARAWCYSRQNHTAAMLLSRLRDPVKNGAGIAQSVQWLSYRLNHWEIEARFPVGGTDLFFSQKSTHQANAHITSNA
jgi:ribosomal protein L22